jgi:hypothetical protein
VGHEKYWQFYALDNPFSHLPSLPWFAEWNADNADFADNVRSLWIEGTLETV